MTTYNALPYPSYAKTESDPTLLAAYARAFGIPAQEPTSCSMLEIGCGTAGNIIPLAERYSASTFTGIDLAEAQIQAGQEIIDKIQLQNISLQYGDISKFCSDTTFDYIVCHGVFSWVPHETQEAILNTAARYLAPHGILFLTYNVLPGWRQKGVIRDVLQYGANLQKHTSPKQQVEAGINFLSLVARSKNPNDLYGSYLNEAATRLSHAHPSYVFHEYLETFNTPFLFSELEARLSTCDLHFFSETKLALSSSDDLDVEAQGLLASLNSNYILKEQALDFFRNRSFRESLICRREANSRAAIDPREVKNFSFSTDMRLHPQQDKKDLVTFVELGTGKLVEVPPSSHTLVLTVVAKSGACGSFFKDILEQCRELVEPQLLAILISLWKSGLITPSISPYLCLGTLERLNLGLASDFSRIQSFDLGLVTSLRHRSVELSEREKSVLRQCDGKVRLDKLPGIEKLIDLGFVKKSP